MSCDPVTAGLNPALCAAQAVADAPGAAANSAIDALAKALGKVAAGMLRWLAEQLSTATSVDLSLLTPSGGPSILAITWAIALVMCVMLLVIQVGWAALTRNPKGIWVALRGVAIALPGSMVVLMALPIFISMVDAMSSGVMHWSLTNQGARVLTDMADVLSKDTLGLGTALLEVVLIVSAAMVYVALLLRMLLILIAAVMAPLAFAGAVAEWSSKWSRRWIELTLALVVSKLLLVIVFATGFAIIYGANQAREVGLQTPQQVSQVAAGGLVLLLAGFTPMAALKLIHFAGDSLGQLHGLHQVAGAGGQKVIDAGKYVAKKVISASSGVPVSSGKDQPDPPSSPLPSSPDSSSSSSPSSSSGPATGSGGGSPATRVPVSSGSGQAGGSSGDGPSPDTSAPGSADHTVLGPADHGGSSSPGIPVAGPGPATSLSPAPVSASPAELPAKESV